MSIETKTRVVSDVITYVERQFGDEAGVQVTSSDIIRWINAGQREIAENNLNINATSASTDIIQNQNAYPLATDPNLPNINRIRSVRFNGSALNAVTFEQAENFLLYNNQYPPEYGDPSDWWEDAGTLYLYPTPNLNYPKALTIHFTTVPKPVALATDTLDIPDSYFNTLIQYVMGQAYELDENFQAAQVKEQQFEKSLGILANRTESQDNTFPCITLDPEDMIY
jgi:hypothetical protein